VENGTSVHHPHYFYLPKLLRGRNGEFFYFSVRNTIERLLKESKYDCVFSSWLYPDSWAAARFAKRHGLPLFVKVHGTDVNRLLPGSALTAKSLEVTDQAEKVICVSNALRERLVQLGCRGEKLEVLYNGVDRSLFCPMDKKSVRYSLGVPDDETIILYVGNLKKEKGIFELLQAFEHIAALPDKKKWSLVIIGTGPMMSSVRERMANFLANGRVKVLGNLPLRQIALWMNAATLLCLPSYMEGVPNVVLEAISCGSKVVATDVGGIPEIAVQSSSLILVPPRSAEALVDSLIAHACDNENRNEWQPASWQENARQIFTIFFNSNEVPVC